MTEETFDRVLKYLYDIKNAIYDIEQFTNTVVSLAQYESNRMVKMATERALITVGEAVNRILHADETIQISSSKRIVQFRNRITHEYDGIDDTQVWVIIKRYIPQLKNEVDALIQQREQ